jgi:two-component system cell cycle response regulator DivK
MKLRILVVDDDPANLKLATAVLENAGHQVQQATSAESALRMITAEPPQIVLLDVRLPVMDGLTLAGLLRKDESTSNVRIVACTADVMQGAEERALAAGCDGYIAKPINVRTLAQQLTKYINIA